MPLARNHAVTLRDIVLFGLTMAGVIWLLGRGGEQLGYHWHWRQIPGYLFTDVDGRQPAFWISIEKMIEERVAAGGPPDKDERGIGTARYGHIHLDHRRAEQARLYQTRYRLEGLPAPLGPV